MLRRSFDKSRKIQRTGRSEAAPFTKTDNKVEADIYIDGVWDQEKKKEVAGTIAECMKCGHKTESFGTEEKSKRRCLVLLKVGCPNGESNFYVEKEKIFECAGCKKSFPVSHWDGPEMNICPGCGQDSIPF